ncbi:MAG: ribonuclease III [Planctomycetota bacterium]
MPPTTTGFSINPGNPGNPPLIARETLAQCEERIGYRFRDPALLAQALTHSSARTADEEGNERMEFLGDAILGLVISAHLFQRFPDQHEGELTRIKSAIVARNTLAQQLQAYGLTAFVRIGKGLALKTRLPTSVLANIYEAIVAAIYLDGGLDPAAQFCLDSLLPVIGGVVDDTSMRNYKSMLQQLAQRRLGSTPQYRVLKIRGPEHGKSFQVAAVIGDTRYKPAWGKSKKDSEQRAAHEALTDLRGKHGDDPVFENWPPLPGTDAPPPPPPPDDAATPDA